MILNLAARVRILSGGQYAQGSPKPSSDRGSTSVPEQLNRMAVTGACKVIDGCSLALCSGTVSVVSAGICHRNKINSIA